MTKLFLTLSILLCTYNFANGQEFDEITFKLKSKILVKKVSFPTLDGYIILRGSNANRYAKSEKNRQLLIDRFNALKTIYELNTDEYSEELFNALVLFSDGNKYSNKLKALKGKSAEKKLKRKLAVKKIRESDDLKKMALFYEEYRNRVSYYYWYNLPEYNVDNDAFEINIRLPQRKVCRMEIPTKLKKAEKIIKANRKITLFVLPGENKYKYYLFAYIPEKILLSKFNYLNCD